MRNALAISGLTLILAMAFALAAPAVRAQEDLAAVDPTLAANPAPAPETVAPEAVLKMVRDKDSTIALVDTQPADGYAEGHIPGAVNYPWVMQIKTFPISLPRNKTLIMYGSCPNDTSDLIKQLAEYGYFNIKVMDGGWYKWVALKYPASGKGNSALAQATTDHAPSAQATAAPSTVAQSTQSRAPSATASKSSAAATAAR